MTIATDLLQRHFQTLVDDNAQWQTLIADDILWELAYAPALGHPARLLGRVEAVRHVSWFLGAVENFRFFDLKVYPFVDPEGAVGEVKAEGLIKPTGRIYHQDYVLFLRAARSEEHTSELQSPYDLVCRLLLEKKKQRTRLSPRRRRPRPCLRRPFAVHAPHWWLPRRTPLPRRTF